MRGVMNTILAAALVIGNVAAMPAAADDTASYASTVQRHVDTYRAGDLDGFMATFSDDAVVVANGMSAHGKAQIRAFYAANFAPGAPAIRIVSSSMLGQKLFLEIAYILPDGSEMCCSQSLYTVENGLITRINVIG